MQGEGEDLRWSWWFSAGWEIVWVVDWGEKSLGYAITVMQVEIEVHDLWSPFGRWICRTRVAFLGEEHDAEHDIRDITEPAGAITKCVMPSSIPVDGDVSL